ncbi:hypothetical protein ACTHSM_05975 [Neisseria sp. P0009.S001]|jgi:hypothetical protein|uniref:hypothetical protein n=1 Tax=unclassified Neisseria TaxID=2623750 RepID=UPI001CAB6AF9|nr:hypothetical protein [Neisseria sp.]DAF35761.1 MAG TPA: hypothetical protein [Caudoviricetes sp.]
MLVKPKVIDRKKILPLEVVEAASWRVSPQAVRVWKDKDHARRMMVLGKTIARAKSKNAPVMAALERDALLGRQGVPPVMTGPSEDDLRSWLLSPSQAQAVEDIQKLAREIKRLGDLINQQNVVFSLRQDVLRLSELSSYLVELDDKLGRAKYAAKRLGVNPVADDFKNKMEFKNGNGQTGKAA